MKSDPKPLPFESDFTDKYRKRYLSDNYRLRFNYSVLPRITLEHSGIPM